MGKRMKKKLIKASSILEILLIFSMSFAMAFFMSDNLVSSIGSTTLTGTQSLPDFGGSLMNGGKAYKFYGSYADGSTLWVGPNGEELTVAKGNLPGGTTSQTMTQTVKNIYTGQTFGGGVAGSLVAGVAWGATAYLIVHFVGKWIGLDQGTQKALEYSLTSGSFVAGTVRAFAQNHVSSFASGQGFLGTLGAHPYLTGLGVAAIVFVLTYKKTETKTINFQCLPFEAPLGGAKCEECNKDKLRPCTEYRCRSLGQACQLLNPDTTSAQCAWVGRNDVSSPIIVPDTSALKPIGLKYTPDNAVRPDHLGSKVVTSSGGCLPAFTPLEFGFTTNEPSQCKVDYNHTQKLEEMEFFLGDTNYYLYNHTQKMRLPGPLTETDQNSPLLRNDGYYALYVRCRDANGNENVDEYSFAFCVDKGKDTTPPLIEEFSLPSGSFVAFGKDVIPIEAYINEPSECKWSVQDKSYEDMENSLECDTDPSAVNANLQYTCRANLTGVANNEDNIYYFRCKDQPAAAESDRNTNRESKALVLKGSKPLYISKVLPNETITGSTDAVKVDLELETSAGAQEGKAICYFSSTGAKDSYITMFETSSFSHRQTLTLPRGNYRYYFRCFDAGGNTAENSTSFEVFVDKEMPRVSRVYRQQDALKVVTDEDAQCVFSFNNCNYNVDDALVSAENTMIYSDPEIKYNLFAPWQSGVTYYIKCRDKYGNEPSPNQCSIIASGVQLTKDEMLSG